MISIKNLYANILQIKVSKKIQDSDFKKITPQVDKLIKKHKTIKLLVDGTAWHGWKGFRAFRQHMKFVFKHQKYVTKIAVITGYSWQRCLISIMKIFVHPHIKTFDKKHARQAQQWLKAK